MEIDFVLHGDGPAAAWAAAAAPGALLGVAGAGAARRPAGRPPAAGRRRDRAAGDQPDPRRGARRRPAASRCSRWPAPRRSSRSPRRTGVAVRWLHRGGTAPGESTLLADAVAALDRPDGDDVFAWVAAESGAVRAIRADLRGRWGLGRAQHHAIGYWRRGRAMSPAG